MPHLQSRNRRSSSRRSVSRRKSKSRRNSRRKSKSRRNSRRKSKSRRNSRRKSKSRLKPMMSSVNHPNARRPPVAEDEEQGFTPIQPGIYVRIGENGIDRTGFGKWARVIEVTDDKALLKFKVGDQSHRVDIHGVAIPDIFQYLEIDLDRCQLTTETQDDHKPNELNIPEGFATDDERYHVTLYPTPEDDQRREAEEDALYND